MQFRMVLNKKIRKDMIMRILALLALTLALTACMGTRGRVGGQKVCENEYLFGVISLAELFDPCGK